MKNNLLHSSELFWFQVSPLRNKRGRITWFFGQYIEFQEEETGEFYLIHYTKIKFYE